MAQGYLPKKIYSIFLIFTIISNTFCLRDASNSLKDAYQKYFKFGTAIGSGETTEGKDAILQQYNSITPCNELKPDAILNQGASQSKGENVNPQVNFGGGTKAILKFCEDNKVPLRGHTFVWHGQTPDWLFKENFNSNGGFVKKDVMDKRLENFIKNTFEIIARDYPNLNLYSYDVCNEVFFDNGKLRDASSSKWWQVYGDDSFIVNAFTFARKYAPSGCELYINDYNEYIDTKTNGIYNMAMKLKGLGVIDGIGMQSHLSTDFPSVGQYKTALEKFISSGLHVIVSELDVGSNNDDTQAKYYKDLFTVLVQHAEPIQAVIVWGSSDEHSWRGKDHPLLFSNHQPKKSFYSVMEVVK